MEYPSPRPPSGTGVPLGRDLAPVEVLWDGDGVTPPPPGKDMGPVEVL